MMGSLARRLLSSVPAVGDFPEKLNPLHLSDPGKYLHEINRARHEIIGPLYTERIGPDVEVLYIADPGIVQRLFALESAYPKHFVPQAWSIYGESRKRKRGLFFLDGPEWLAMRRTLNPLLLNKDSMEKFLPFIQEEAQRLSKSLLTKSTTLSSQGIRSVSQLPSELHRWSVRTILAVIFGDSHIFSEEEESRLISCVETIFDVSARLQFTSAEEACRKETPDWLEFAHSADSVFELLAKSMGGRRISLESLAGQLRAQGLSSEYIERIAMDFIIAAVDTTSITTLWTIHLLSLDPYIQADIRTQAPSKKLIHHCIRESSRLYPVSPFITRILDKPTVIGGSNFSPGQLLLYSTYSMSRDSRIFQSPEDFIPRRWEHTPSTFASIPFGFRARSCIGKKLAEWSMELLLQELLSKYIIHSMNSERAQMIMKYIGLPDRIIQIGIEEL